jgi:Putative addiction module component
MISFDELSTNALLLPDKERARLAHSLLLSLGDMSDESAMTTLAYPKEYEREIERRVQGYEQGQMGAISKDVFIKQMQQRTL